MMYKPGYHKNGGRYLSGMGSAFLAAVLALAASGCGVWDPVYWRGVDDLQRIERNRGEGVKGYYPTGEMERREEEGHDNMGIIKALREKHQQQRRREDGPPRSAAAEGVEVEKGIAADG